MEILGYMAGTVTTLSLVPQLVRSLRTRSTRDISWGWLGTMITGLLLWLAYGCSIMNYPMIFFNLVGFLMFLVLAIAKYCFERE
jgi:MtN3 and saliva related transmembrane protein